MLDAARRAGVLGGGGGVSGATVITAGAVPGHQEQTAQTSGMSQTPLSSAPRGCSMRLGTPRLLRALCILSVLAGLLPHGTAQWFYPLGSEDTTPEPGTSPATPTLPTLSGEEGRCAPQAPGSGEEGTLPCTASREHLAAHVSILQTLLMRSPRRSCR